MKIHMILVEYREILQKINRWDGSEHEFLKYDTDRSYLYGVHILFQLI